VPEILIGILGIYKMETVVIEKLGQCALEGSREFVYDSANARKEW
jgi:hypothetical protein